MTKSQQLEQFIDRLGLKHFKGREFTPYWSRTRNKVKNSCPDQSLWPNIVQTIVILDLLRQNIGAPIELLSTYRSPEYNAAVGGEPNSFHMQFKAIDFACDEGSPATWAKMLRAMRGKQYELPGGNQYFKFLGGIGKYDSFVHVDTRGYNANW